MLPVDDQPPNGSVAEENFNEQQESARVIEEPPDLEPRHVTEFRVRRRYPISIDTRNCLCEVLLFANYYRVFRYSFLTFSEAIRKAGVKRSTVKWSKLSFDKKIHIDTSKINRPKYGLIYYSSRRYSVIYSTTLARARRRCAFEFPFR